MAPSILTQQVDLNLNTKQAYSNRCVCMYVDMSGCCLVGD